MMITCIFVAQINYNWTRTHRIHVWYIWWHGSHQYTPVMLAFFYQHHGSVMGEDFLLLMKWWSCATSLEDFPTGFSRPPCCIRLQYLRNPPETTAWQPLDFFGTLKDTCYTNDDTHYTYTWLYYCNEPRVSHQKIMPCSRQKLGPGRWTRRISRQHFPTDWHALIQWCASCCWW